jgi:formylmethanofuran:tetrahydromethanopterin formyltransferase
MHKSSAGQAMSGQVFPSLFLTIPTHRLEDTLPGLELEGKFHSVIYILHYGDGFNEEDSMRGPHVGTGRTKKPQGNS